MTCSSAATGRDTRSARWYSPASSSCCTRRPGPARRHSSTPACSRFCRTSSRCCPRRGSRPASRTRFPTTRTCLPRRAVRVGRRATGARPSRPRRRSPDYIAARPRRARPMDGPMPRLLVFDQFEELFTTYPDALAAAAGVPGSADPGQQVRPGSAGADRHARGLRVPPARFLRHAASRAEGQVLPRTAAEAGRRAGDHPAPGDHPALGGYPALVRPRCGRRPGAAPDDQPRRYRRLRTWSRSRASSWSPSCSRWSARRCGTRCPPSVSTITLDDAVGLADVDISLARFYSDAVRSGRPWPGQ